MKQLIAFFSVLFAFSSLLGEEIPGYSSQGWLSPEDWTVRRQGWRRTDWIKLGAKLRRKIKKLFQLLLNFCKKNCACPQATSWQL